MKYEDDEVIEPEVYEVSQDMKLKKHNAVMENALIEARYSLTVEEQRLVLATIAMLDSIETAPSGFPMLKIPKKMIIETTGMHEKDYKVIRNSLERLMQRIIRIETIEKDRKKRFKLYQWFSKAEYKEGDSFIEVQFHPDLKPYLLELKEKFTKIPLKYIFPLRSKYSIRLYELLKRYEDTGFRSDYLPELREKLGVEEGEYKRFEAFERKVLKQAVSEINEKTDIEVSYKKKKTGRKITHIEFTVKPKDANQGDTTQMKKLPSQSVDNKGQKKEVVDLWDTTLTILENSYNADPYEVDILRAFTYAAYKTDETPKIMVIKTDVEAEKGKEKIREILAKYFGKIKEIVRIESNGNYIPKISKSVIEKGKKLPFDS